MLSLLSQVNWPKFLDATSEDLYPYVTFGLEPYLSFLEARPEWERLFKARRLTAGPKLLLRQELRKTFETLRGQRIPPLSLKGVGIANTPYLTPPLCPFTTHNP